MTQPVHLALTLWLSPRAVVASGCFPVTLSLVSWSLCVAHGHVSRAVRPVLVLFFLPQALLALGHSSHVEMLECAVYFRIQTLGL